MAFLTRTDPARNSDRFYVVEIMPSLFGNWTVLREWAGADPSIATRADEAETAQRKACHAATREARLRRFPSACRSRSNPLDNRRFYRLTPPMQFRDSARKRLRR